MIITTAIIIRQGESVVERTSKSERGRKCNGRGRGGGGRGEEKRRGKRVRRGTRKSIGRGGVEDKRGRGRINKVEEEAHWKRQNKR